MKTKILEIILNALSAAEDTLYDTKMEFKSLSTKEMTYEYGESGLTCQEHLDIFQLEVDRLKQCVEWLESLQEQPQIAYGKHEFCKSMNCPYLTPATTCDICGCFYTAKQFHHWLQENNFKIIKENADDTKIPSHR